MLLNELFNDEIINKRLIAVNKHNLKYFRYTDTICCMIAHVLVYHLRFLDKRNRVKFP